MDEDEYIKALEKLKKEIDKDAEQFYTNFSIVKPGLEPDAKAYQFASECLGYEIIDMELEKRGIETMTTVKHKSRNKAISNEMIGAIIEEIMNSKETHPLDEPNC